MKTLLNILGLLTVISFNSSSQAEACAKCGEINQLRAEALKVTEVESDAAKKQARSIIVRTSKLLDQHDVASTNQEDVEEFRRLVVLVSDVITFDPLMSVADHLQSRMSSKKGQQRWAAYKSALPLITNSCKREFLEVVIKELDCSSKVSKPEDAVKCVHKPAFNYKKCMSKKKS